MASIPRPPSGDDSVKTLLIESLLVTECTFLWVACIMVASAIMILLVLWELASCPANQRLLFPKFHILSCP
jgi:hypothetical protein